MTNVMYFLFAKKALFLTFGLKPNLLFMTKNYLKLALGLAFAFMVNQTVQAQTVFSYTGATETYTVPDGVTLISIEAKGSKGLDGSPAVGGNGAIMYGEFDVNPGDVITVYAGGNSAGIKAGGDGSWAENTTTGTLLIVAGGGGGATHSKVGAGAPTTNDGTASISHDGYTDGAPGTGGNGGGAGTGAWGTGGGGGWLSAGSAGLGSPGGAMPCKGSYGTTYAGGAGGGYSGGGGVDMGPGWGTGGGGAGGSYNIGETQDNVAAANAGLGEVTINEICTPLSVTVSDEEICLGESFTLDAISEGGGTITWDGGVINGEPFTPETAGSITYTATSDAELDCGYSVDIIVNELPEVAASVDLEVICAGESVVFSVSGADSYTWTPGDVVAGDPYTIETEGLNTFTVEGIDETTGCVYESVVEVMVNAIPDVTANVDDNEICIGESIVLTGGGAVTYEWEGDVVDGDSYTPDMTGEMNFFVTGTDENGCTDTASVDVTVFEAIEITYVGEDEMMGSDASIDITVTGGNPAYSFDWDNDGTGDFDDTEDLTDIAGGTYVVVVEDEAGCTGTATIDVGTQLGIDSDDLFLTVYPNPIVDHVTIQTNGKFSYILMSTDGAQLTTGSASELEELDLSELADGVYLLSVSTINGSRVIQLVKQ